MTARNESCIGTNANKKRGQYSTPLALRLGPSRPVSPNPCGLTVRFGVARMDAGMPDRWEFTAGAGRSRGVDASALPPTVGVMSTSVVQHASLPARQLDMFDAGSGLQRFGVATCSEVESALGRADCAAALSVSGGKDSQALAYRVFEHLDQIGFAGPRVLVHSDLGRVEWRDSMPVCERVALRLGAELIVVRRQAGDMMDRWLSRWQGNVHRYRALSCVKLILPWSTAQSRFCTSELKAAPIASALRKRFPTGTLVTAIGLRRDESRARALAPIWRPDNRTTRVRGAGLAWHPLSAWSRQEVIDYIRLRGDVLHEAYRIYGSTRVSCSFCILASEHDLRAATRCEANAAIYREMVELEISSTFAFQANRWLGDMAPALLDVSTWARLQEAKERAAERSAAEGLLPDRLLFVKGWPTVMPSAEEAGLIAHVRRRVAAAVGLEVDCTDAASVLDRYRHLMDRSASAKLGEGLALSPLESQT